MRLNELINLDKQRLVNTLPPVQDIPVDNSLPPLPDNELVYKRDYIGIESALLKDTFILCLDKSKHKLVMKEHPGIPIYLLEEMEELLPYTDDEEFIRQVHACKKKFGDNVIPKDKQTFRFTDMEANNGSK